MKETNYIKEKIEKKAPLTPATLTIPIVNDKSEYLLKPINKDKEGTKFDYGYNIILNNPNEDGMMETYLSGN